MLHLLPGLPPVEVEVDRPRARGEKNPRWLLVVLAGGAEAWVNTAQKVAALPEGQEAAVVFGTLPITQLVGKVFVTEGASSKYGARVRVAMKRTDRLGDGGKFNWNTQTAPHTWERL